MSGPSRYDWKHGINVNQQNHPLPRNDAFNSRLFPPWNACRNRRAVTFRSIKVFSGLLLQLEWGRAVETGDMVAAEALEERNRIAKNFKAQDQDCRKLTEEETALYRASAQHV